VAFTITPYTNTDAQEASPHWIFASKRKVIIVM